MILLSIIIILVAAGLWWYRDDTREAALLAAQQHCQSMDVQLLDGSVMSNGFRLKRSQSGTLVVIQKFCFEFSTTGDQRYQGRIELLGKRRLKIELDAHKF